LIYRIIFFLFLLILLRINYKFANLIKLHYKLWGKKVIFYGFLVIYFVILIYLCNETTIWEDECYTLNTTSHSLSGVISQSYQFEAQPPLYFILLKCWRQINGGVFFARLLSVFFIGLSAYFFHRLVNLISGKESSKWLLIIFLLNPFTVWAAIEMRSYAMIIFLSTISIYFFLQFLISNKKKYLYSFIITAIIGLYTQYLFIFLIISLLFSFLVFRGWKSFFILCIYFIPVIILFLPNFLFISHDISIQQTTLYTWKSTIYLILQTPCNLLLGLNNVTSFWKYIIILFTSFCALIAYHKLYSVNLSKNSSFGKLNFILITVLFFVLLYAIGFSLFRIQYADLYMAVAFPLLILLMTVFKVYSPSYRRLIYTSFSLYLFFLLLFIYRNRVKFYDFKSIAKYVTEIENNNEPILFYRNGLSLPFDYYYKGKNLIYPLPNAVTFDKNYLINFKDTTEMRKSIECINSTSNSYILISDDKAVYLGSLDMNRKMVDDYLVRNYKTTLDTLYFGKSKNYYLRIRCIEKIKK